ncbi:hypothetical protein PTKIN_Ptkin15bG0015800 [Pterospermum kingtungense]
MHHGGRFVYNPTISYSGKRVSYFDLCHVEAMSMLEIWDMQKQLGYDPVGTRVFWRTAGGALRADCIRPLLVDFDVLNMVAVMPRNRYLHVFIVQDEAEDVEHQPPISVADESESEHEEEKHVEEVVVEDEEPGYKVDFVNHEYDLEEQADSVADIQVPVFGVGDEADEDELENGVADELHRNHGSDEDGDSNWTEFNTQTDMVNP